MSQNEIKALFARYTAGAASHTETEWLMQQLATYSEAELEVLLSNEWQQLQEADARYTADSGKQVLQNILANESQQAPVHVVTASRRRRISMWTAAAVLLLLAAGVWIWRDSRQTNPLPQYAATGEPGKRGAVLTLSDGRQVMLDSAGDGLLANDNTVKVLRKDGSVIYEGMAGELIYNTISTLKGQQWQLTLGDGTRVWLNAASSIHYPLSFTDSIRVVEITGEACFEVAPNSKVPFLVRAGTREIRVLGTRFNVNAYSDEPVFKATLLNGAVSVSNGPQTVLLKPGEQAVEQDGNSHLNIQQTDTSNVMAWINGRFRFDQSDLQTVMRQIGRWYDMEIEYKGAVPDYHFAGGTFRSSKLEEVLKVLALSGVHFKVENRKIIVMQ